MASILFRLAMLDLSIKIVKIKAFNPDEVHGFYIKTFRSLPTV